MNGAPAHPATMKPSRRWGTRLFVAAFYGTAEEGAEKIDFGREDSLGD
ncbi:MAG TPA: hypothetical protein VHW70_02595 [Edaphobacter sp.]|jgi:hypothetical protein|nr:hypothetical protein [Edaphobacter sp.]